MVSWLTPSGCLADNLSLEIYACRKESMLTKIVRKEGGDRGNEIRRRKRPS
jgi:hypothetical protein